MSMPIASQGEQFDVFDGDRWDRDRRASVSQDDVADMLGGPQIMAGLNNTRQAADYANPHAPVPDSYWHDDEADEGRRFFDQEHGLDREPPPEYDDYGPGPHPDFHDGSPQPFGTPAYSPRSAPYDDHPPSFSAARRQADGGPSGELFNPMLFMPGERQRWESEALGGEAAPHWPTAKQAAGVVPAPVDPVWLGHGYAPGNRIGLHWRDGTIPGTVTHLDGPKIGVRWDDGQHSTEEPQDIHPLH